MRPRWYCSSMALTLRRPRRAGPACWRRHADVVHGDGHAALRGVAEADGLDAVHEVRGLVAAEHLVAVGHDLAQGAAVHGPVGLVGEAQPPRQDLVEDEPPDGRLQRALRRSSSVSSSQVLTLWTRTGVCRRSSAHWWLGHRVERRRACRCCPARRPAGRPGRRGTVGTHASMGTPRPWSGSSSPGSCPASAPRPARRRRATAGWPSRASSRGPRPGRPC